MYIENFINPRYRVDLDFDKLEFGGDISSKSSCVLEYLASIFLMVLLVVNVCHVWWLAVIPNVLALCLVFPPVTSFLQSKMGVTFSGKFIWIASILLVGLVFGMMKVSKAIDEKRRIETEIAAEQQRQAAIAIEQEQMRIAKEKEKIRLDSLNSHQQRADSLLQKKKMDEAMAEYEAAIPFADELVASMIYYKIGNLFFANKQYKEALSNYLKISQSQNNSSSDTLQYNKAICYLKNENVQAAVYALKRSVRTKRVELLFNKINPIKTRYSYVDKPVERRRIAYYEILCGDGSSSFSSSRRGACSRHGGVADWNHPVYEKYTVNQKQKISEKYREYGEL